MVLLYVSWMMLTKYAIIRAKQGKNNCMNRYVVKKEVIC